MPFSYDSIACMMNDEIARRLQEYCKNITLKLKCKKKSTIASDENFSVVILSRPRNAEENHASYVNEDRALIAGHGDAYTKCSAKVADGSTVAKLATVLERGQINTLMTGRVRTPVVHYTGTRSYSTMENSFQYQ